MKTMFLIQGVVAIGGTGLLSASEPTAFDGGRFFEQQVLPILEQHCFKCHSREHDAEGGLVLDTRAGCSTGGESGPAVKAGDLRNSPVIQAVRHVDPETAMPPKKKLTPMEIALLETWVLLGAPDPRPE
ncbi:MAG: hypothetical protein JNJ83_16560 [Verrucomicrobiaceae bacterium]|nr:hypothetical protein [Verrucomicrobiaceae bacterium]